MRKIILKSSLALGDIGCLTAVPRELATQYRGLCEVAVDTPFPALFENNPHIVHNNAKDLDDSWEVIECHYDRDPVYSVHQSNQRPVHLLTSYCVDVANSLGLPGLFPKIHAGDIHLSRDEYSRMSLPHQHYNCQRYWVICPGGKTDATVKTWPPEYWQKVIDFFRGRIQFVQVGMTTEGHYSPDLRGVIDLRDMTSVRELILTIHASCGVIGGISACMHLAAAVPLPTWQRRPKPCVVIAGGREPRSWYGYPTHRVIETVGSLSCCDTGGCWQSHTVPIKKDGTERLCHRVVNGFPKCMTAIRPESVILEIERILEGQGIE